MDDQQTKSDVPTEPTSRSQVREHLLSDREPTTVVLPRGTLPLDIQLIDGQFRLRTLEPMDAEHTVTVTVRPAALGTVLDLDADTATHVPCRSSAAHFFI